MFARRAWARAYCAHDPNKNASGLPHLFCFDTFAESVDTTNAYSDPLSYATGDGLHANQWQAYIAAWKLYQILDKILPGDSGAQAYNSQGETFDLTYNPYAAINTNPYFTGTTGTGITSSGGLTFSGTVPTGYSLFASGTTGTQTVTAGFHARPDGLNGTSFYVTVACSGGPSTQYYYLGGNYPNFTTLGVPANSNIYAEVDYQVSGQTNMGLAPSAVLTVFDTANSQQNALLDGYISGNYGPIPNTGVTVGSVPPLGVGRTLFSITPWATLNNIGTTTGTQYKANGQVFWGYDCSTSGGGTVDFLDMRVLLK
jgi:hypothetical protein